jgi:3-oxoacyl-[acyl-carrier-protein] synthase II
MGAISPLGNNVADMYQGLCRQRSAVRLLDDFYPEHGLQTNVVGAVTDFNPSIPRHFKRSMSRMSLFAHVAAQEALAELDQALWPAMGMVVGSTIGSPHALEEFFSSYFNNGLSKTRTHTFFKIMSHSIMANLAQSLGIGGYCVSVSGACSTGCQAIGLAFDSIALGRQNLMLSGGADEYHLLVSAVFEMLDACAAVDNALAAAASRPFDKTRCGIVCAEGAGMLLLEELEHAKKRQANIWGEVVGFGSSVTTSNIAHPSKDEIKQCMSLAINDAGIKPEDIDYVNAHATATIYGDIAEGLAIEELLGRDVAVSSLKGHLGHTMAASGSLETIASVMMLANRRLIPTLNLHEPDPACGNINLIRKHFPMAESRPPVIIKNSFALGGLNSSLIIRGYDE